MIWLCVWLEKYYRPKTRAQIKEDMKVDNIIDFEAMTKEEKLEFISERGGYIKDGTGVNSDGHEFRDDHGSALFIG